MPDFPLPRPDAQTRPFWDGCRQDRLMYQRCRTCESVQFTPRAICQHCHHPELAWETSSRLGTVMSHTRVHRAAHAAFRSQTPYVIAILDMDEGFRLMVNADPSIANAIRIGHRVRVGFTIVGDMALPVAKELA